ncbi:unnamed protein product [Hymenolepis diminuta]|uniref:Uncharacterized protein n=1 Tax=Hymenolepis diminuta TaxID=6216 RepID=A0A0R3SAR8_HYMDI|nr:unnamed protein product [Hymenolepis diminuta]
MTNKLSSLKEKPFNLPLHIFNMPRTLIFQASVINPNYKSVTGNNMNLRIVDRYFMLHAD